jgi:hypothetical protein
VTAVRTLLSVVLAAALVGASLPALDDARVERTASRLESTATRLSDAAARLAATDDPVRRGARGAGRTVVVRLPDGGFAEARAAYLSVGGHPNASAPATVGYRVAGRPPRTVDAGVRFATGGGPLVLGPGRHVLRLTLVRTPAGVAVRVRADAARASATAAENGTGTGAGTGTPTTASQSAVRTAPAPRVQIGGGGQASP